tara:strand:- start:476 stop:796 length:321 start_codon:yes stop_codon:yes gene_type:complete
MSNLHDAVLELIETQSLHPYDYDSAWEMYMDANEDGEIDALLDARAIETRDGLVKWVCDGNLEYLDMACEEDAEDDEMILLKDAHLLYLQYVAFNAVVDIYDYFNQ